ncbi:uncharacterized protein RJT21DRAFT_37635 [Scheffersomyces amazonensis]|uniref:uncharacterized protein n=1 Tax=Scheffersomyces amazonensis TaxID=1078765 RepID=UPI00315CBBC6
MSKGTKDSNIFQVRDYRGATIEDLDVRPAISINPTTSIDEAIEISYEYEFDFLPVIHEANRKLLGVLNVKELIENAEKIRKSPLKPITRNYMLWFHQKARQNYDQEHEEDISPKKTPVYSTIYKPGGSKKYSVLTPITPLEELAAFFNSGNYFAIITNGRGDFVYGVATPEDLKKFESSRPKL